MTISAVAILIYLSISVALGSIWAWAESEDGGCAMALAFLAGFLWPVIVLFAVL